MKRLIILTTLLLTLSLGLRAQNAPKRAFTLKEAMDYAVTNSYTAQNSSIDLEKAKRQMNELIGIGAPQIGGSVSYNYNIKPPVAFFPAAFFGGPPGTFQAVTISPKQTNTIGLSLSQLLLDGTYFIGLQAAKKFKEISVDINQKDIMGIKADVATTYYAVLVLEENRKILAESLTKLNDTYSQTEKIFKEGLIEENDLDQLKLIISTLKTTQVSLDRQAELGKKLLNFQLGIELNEPVTLTDNLDKVLTDTPNESPLTNSFKPESNLDYIILRKQSALADLNYKRVIASYTPSLSGFVSYQWQNFSNDNRIFAGNSQYYGVSVAGLNLRIPIFDGLSTVQRIKSAKLDYKKTEIGLKQLEEGLKLQSDQATTNYNNALDQFKLKKENLDLAKKVKEKALIKYREGVGSSLEVTTTENQYLQIQADYISSLLNLFNAKIAINKLTNNF